MIQNKKCPKCGIVKIRIIYVKNGKRLKVPKVICLYCDYVFSKEEAEDIRRKMEVETQSARHPQDAILDL